MSSEAVNLLLTPRIAAGRIITWLAGFPRIVTFVEPLFWLLGMRGSSVDFDFSRVKRVLVIRLDEIGDVVMTTPLLRELRRNLPEAWITLIVHPATANLVELSPYVNEVLVYDWKTKGRLRQLKQYGRALRLSWKHLWRRRFELAIVPRWDTDRYHATSIAYLCGARWRVGYSESVSDNKRHLNSGFDRLLTQVLNNNTTLEHEVERNLDVIRCLGGTFDEDRLELWIGEEDEGFAERVFDEFGVQPGRLVIAVGPSGGHSALKQWPASRFVELGQWLHTKYGCRILIIGGPEEEALGCQLERGIGDSAINVVGKTTLRQTAALLKRCRLYVGNDAGPMHIAAAVRVPVVALFGSSCHHRFRPWGDGHRLVWLGLPCSPCFRLNHGDRCGRCILDQPHCMQDITSEQVKKVIESQFAEAMIPALVH